MEIKFKRDTSFRKQFFTPESFAHPAKMDAQLLVWLVERYTEPGEVILDPMAGMGTTMLACTLGRDVVLVELEEKFCNMCKSNWEKVSAMPQLGYEMGQCNIVQGDARQLEGLLVDKCIFSPPYVSGGHHDGVFRAWGGQLNTKSGCGQIATKEGGYGENPNNVGNLPYGQIDKIVTSPPFGEAQSGGGIAQKGYQGSKHGPTDLVGKRSYMPENIGGENNISNLPYGQIDKIVTSPPYEASVSDNKEGPGDGGNETNYGRWAKGTAKKQSYTQHGEPTKEVDSIITSPPYEGSAHEPSLSDETIRKTEESQGRRYTRHSFTGAHAYSSENDNIGNLKSDSYLEAMLQVYQQCYKVLKPEGLMILVTKNFIRNKQVIRLDEDTIKLCEQAGFSFLERHYRKLTSQSFWRIIYHQKHPEVEKIEHEDVLVFTSIL